MATANRAASWYFVVLLTLLNAVSYLDRHSIALLAQPISKALGLSDPQIALVIGAGFAVVYAVVSLPLSHLIDRSNRTLLIVGAVLVWSASTIAAAFATGLASLALCRAGVALGEAALVPAAISLIPDLFPPDERIAPTSLFSSMAGIMGKGAFVVGAGLLTLATAMSPRFELAPWQLTLILMGALGGVTALVLFATVREPERISVAPAAVAGDDGFFTHIGRGWRFYLPLFAGLAAEATFTLGMISWTPTLLVRAHGYTLARAGLTFGIVGLLAGLAGTIAWPWLAAHLRRRGRRDAILISLIVPAVLVIPFAIFCPGSTSATVVFVGVAGAQFCLAAIGVLTPLIAQTHGPAKMRARLMSAQLIAMSLVGFTLGPLSVALIAGHWPDDPRALGYGMSIMGLLTGVIAITALAVSRRALLAEWTVIHDV